MTKYEIIIYWSAADNVFIAEMTELKGCIVHGRQKDKVLKAINDVAAEWLAFAS